MITVVQSSALVSNTANAWTTHTSKQIASSELTGDANYLLAIMANVGGNNTSANDFRYRLNAGGVLTGSEARHEPRRSGNNNGHQFGWVGTYTAPSTPVDINLQSNSDGANACLISDYHAIAINLDDLAGADYATDEDTTSNANVASGSWTNGASITIGDGSSDWLVIASSHWLIDSASDSLRFRIDAGGTGRAEIQLEGEDTAEEYCVATMTYLAAPASQTVQAQIRTTAGNHDCDRTFIAAIRLDAFEDHAGARTTTGTSITGVDTDTTVETLAHTTSTAAARDWVFFGMAINDVGEDSKLTERRLEDSTLGIAAGNITRQSAQHGDTDLVPMLLIGELTSVADSTALDIDYIVQEDGDVTPNPEIVEASIVGFSSELAPSTTAVVAGVSSWTWRSYQASIGGVVNVEAGVSEWTWESYPAQIVFDVELDSDLVVTVDSQGTSALIDAGGIELQPSGGYLNDEDRKRQRQEYIRERRRSLYGKRRRRDY